MAKYHLTNKAVEDLADIWNYTFDEWSENQADKYYLLLLDSCQEVAENPNLGKHYDNINPTSIFFFIRLFQIVKLKLLESFTVEWI